MNFKPNENFQYYLNFMVERMEIFWKRYFHVPYPLTDDPIFREFKFTNVYRALDRVSQYLIRNVIYNGKEYSKEDMFFRILLFKHFNKIETWECLEAELGDITLKVDFDSIVEVLNKIILKEPVYGNAYVINCCFFQMPKYSYIRGWSKHRAHLDIFKKEIFENGFINKLLAAQSPLELYNLLHSLDIYGDFTAQQYVFDFMYSPLFDFSENDFIVAGPGAKKGIEWTFDFEGKTNRKGRIDYVAVIKWVHENLEELLAEWQKNHPGKEFIPLPGRMPTLIDLQNCFCETSKYSKGIGNRFSKKKERIKNTFKPSKKEIDFVFPPKWNIVMPEK